MKPIGAGDPLLHDNWLKDTLLKIPRDSSIIDVGAGELKNRKLCDHLQYTSQDLGEYGREKCNIGLQMQWDAFNVDIKSDITNIPVENDSFDSAMCVGVLEHVPDAPAALREIYRIVKSGGYLVITAPFCSITHQAPFYHANGFSEFFYKYWFNNLGIEILDLQKFGNFFDWMTEETRRLPFICSRYSTTFKEEDRFILGLFIQMMEKYYLADQGSSELLCWSICIFGVKK